MRFLRDRIWAWLTLFVTSLLLWWMILSAIHEAFGRERKPIDRETFNAVMDRAYPNGRGPNSTSRGRGFYRGADGNWKVRGR